MVATGKGVADNSTAETLGTSEFQAQFREAQWFSVLSGFFRHLTLQPRFIMGSVIFDAHARGGGSRRHSALDKSVRLHDNPAMFRVRVDLADRAYDVVVDPGLLGRVMVSYFGAGPDHGVPETDPFFPYADAKSSADARLQSSGLDWTIVRPSRLTDEAGTGRIETPRTGAVKGSVPRADVALVVAEVLERPGLAGSVLELNGGDVPVAEELDAHEA